MKTLYESLLDSEDEIFDDTVDAMKKKAIKQFLTKNYDIMTGYDISAKPNKDGKYIVNTLGRVTVKTNLKEFTNGDFVFGTVKTGFSCWNCEKLTSLEGGPKKVLGDFLCSYCEKLTSLKGSPEEVNGDFKCPYCENLITLEGAPEIVGGNFNCYGCEKLTSLEGAPKKIGGYFDCSHCEKLTSLKGAPEIVGDNFDCSYCEKLISLKGSPKEVGGYFNCAHCGDEFPKGYIEKISKIKGNIYY